MTKTNPQKMKSDFREIEVALLIQSENPAEVARQIASLSLIAGFRLLPAETLHMQDLYFDMPDRLLRKHHLSLRFRQINDEEHLTLKGHDKKQESGALDRLEIDVPWSDQGWQTILAELKKRKIPLQKDEIEIAGGDPAERFKKLGLAVIQNRKTTRMSKNIIAKESDDLLAELAVDRVTYRFSGQDVVLHEIEIELKAGGNEPVLKQLIDAFLKKYRDDLRLWPHSKLVSGLAMKRALAEGTLAGLLDEKNQLRPVAYVELERIIRGMDQT